MVYLFTRIMQYIKDIKVAATISERNNTISKIVTHDSGFIMGDFGKTVRKLQLVTNC